MTKRFSGVPRGGGSRGSVSGLLTNDFSDVVQARRRSAANREAGRTRYHVPNQFPHFSYKNGRCMCLNPCCLGPSGCKCAGCSCDPLVGHV
jgi:hypothetical protein